MRWNQRKTWSLASSSSCLCPVAMSITSSTLFFTAPSTAQKEKWKTKPNQSHTLRYKKNERDSRERSSTGISGEMAEVEERSGGGRGNEGLGVVRTSFDLNPK